jgi:F-type H+-transporting ATPase subunit beta
MAGIVQEVTELVITVLFDEDLPKINELIEVQNEQKSKLLVDSIDKNGIVYGLNVRSDVTIVRGQEVKRLNEPPQVPVGEQIIGRVLGPFGDPLDGLAPLSDQIKRDKIIKLPNQSTSFKPPKIEILETGIKVIDFFTPFVKGRKIGIIGGAGVGKTVLTMELINNVAKIDRGLAMFCGIGERIREGHELWETLKENDLLRNTAMFLAETNENPIQRSLVGMTSATVAEYFRDELGKDVLFFADNMYRYVQAKNELSSILNQVPNEGGYGSTLFSDIKILEDRLSSNDKGSITSVQTIYIPADDITDPAVSLIQNEMDSVIVLSRKVAEQGIRPAVDLNLTSSSLLTPEIVGERHYLLSVEVQSLLKKYQSLKNIVAIIGESELSPKDRSDFQKALKLINNFTHHMNVMTKLTGLKGDYFTREQTLKSIEEILI